MTVVGKFEAPRARVRHHGWVTDELLGWCVVANIAEQTSAGPGGGEVRSGTRHFSPGTKVWVLPPQWGDGGDSLMVLGKHRGVRGGHVRMVLPRRHLTNFRVRPIYTASLLADLNRPWRETPNNSGARTWTSREEAEHVMSHWLRPTQTADDPATPDR